MIEAGTGGRLAGRRVLITGGASGIGAATCELFVREGASVAILDRDRKGVAAMQARLGVFGVEADITDEQAVRDGVDAASDALGGMDGIVNCAGTALVKPFAETDLATWRLMLEINLTGVFLVCQQALKYLQAAPSATIVNFASVAVLAPEPNQAAYAAAKSGVIALSKVLAAEFAPTIRCNVLCPGAVDTPMIHGAFELPGALEKLQRRYPLGRIAKPIELANAALFLTSHESSFTTGITLAVDGGRAFH